MATTHTTIANTILAQLGGVRFSLMTGAKNFLAIPAAGGKGASLSFRLPSRSAKNGINFVKVTLDPSDTYTVEFTKIGPAPSLKAVMAGKTGNKITVVATHSDVYAENLQSLFTTATGLDTHL